ncbi:ATP-binding protein [Acidicapsa dinghuensis]|uniref:histidine kinase n=1 Tax=Acidicapsa dinghuensis TaxID=2218256 RepID=A0ABW1EGU2_9BACT|nr:ATP-binding protein [Acidicapsa dinghuensis]
MQLNKFSKQRAVRNWLLASALIVALTGALIWLRADSTSAGILYLVTVVWAATVGGPIISIYLAIVTSLCFDFFFLVPLGTFALRGATAWLAMLVFMVACAIVNRVAEQARRQRRYSEERREHAERLYQLSQEMMLHEDAAGLVREIPRLVAQNFDLDGVLLYVRGQEPVHSSLPSSADEEDMRPLHVMLRQVSPGTEAASPLLYGYVASNLMFGLSSVGVLAWKPNRVSREVAALIASQAAIAITRAEAIEESSRLEAARATEKLRSALIDSMTHELRTPLTAIRAAATTLVEEKQLDDDVRTELATIVEEETERLDALIGEAMEVAEIESDGVRVRLEPMLAGAFLEQVLEGVRRQMGARLVTIDVQQPDKTVWFDPHVLGRVMKHLLENAARYTPSTSKIVLRSQRGQDRLDFVVQDDGPGIDGRDLPHIFEKFYRGRNGSGAAMSSVKGSGMGLAIVRALLSVHGGGIEAESAPGGSSFRLWVPLVERPPEDGTRRAEGSGLDAAPLGG